MKKEVIQEKKKIGKNEFINIVAEEFPTISKKDIAGIVSMIGIKFVELTKQGYEVKFGNMGTFYKKEMAGKEVVDLNTKKKIKIPKYNTLKFKISKTYKKIINS